MKKLFCILISFVLVAGAITSFAGCGPKTPEDNRAVRALDTSFVNVWQGSDGTVYVELKDFEHDDYQFISDSGQGATSIEFSLDGGSSWARQDPVELFFNQTDRGIYSILSYDGNGFTCYLTGHEGENMPQQNPKFNAGADLSITFRIPESDTYKASEWSTATTYTLKAPGTDNSEIFAYHYGAFLQDKAQHDSILANTFESNGFVVYKDGDWIKFGKIESKASPTEPGKYDYTFTSQEELSEEDKTEVAKFEYKFVSKPEYEQNATAESTNLLTSITPDIETYENDLLMSGAWTAVTVDGFEFNFNAANSNYIWKYNVEMPNGSTNEMETYTCTSFILLVRIKATDSTVHSKVHILEYQLSYDPVE